MSYNVSPGSGQPYDERLQFMAPQYEYPSPEVKAYELVSSCVETNNLILLKKINEVHPIDFSKYQWELGYESVDKPEILRYICENSEFVKSEGWHILAAAVRKENKESVQYLINTDNKQRIDPDELKGVAFVYDQYCELMGGK